MEDMSSENIRQTNVFFNSNNIRCAASFYSPKELKAKIPCVVMGHGFTGTKELLVSYAEKFSDAGFAVLTFDYRYFGESEGEPRQIIDVKKQMEDWMAAISFARTLEGVDSERIALWGSSLSGGHVINLGAEDPTLAAIIAQVPAIDKSTHGMSKEAKTKMEREGISMSTLIIVSLKSIAAGVYDGLRALIGLSPYYIPVFGRPGEVAVFTDPESYKALGFFSKGSTWRNEFAPRFMFGLPKYTRGTAEKIKMPLLVCVAEKDTEANPELAVEIAKKAPRGELKTYPASHFDVYYGSVFEQMVADQIKFLCKHLMQ
jgi:pimeloyl-ACP methyl ester carboxylesterase